MSDDAPTRLFAGVDGGGTRTRAVIVDEAGRELGRAEHDGAVVTVARPEDAAEAVRRAVTGALDHAGLTAPVDVLWAGLAGAGTAGPRAGVTRALRSLDLADRVIVGTDVEAAFHDAFGDGMGVLLIAGTGSIAWVRDEAGVERRVGGWGRSLGDEGSGYWIGLEGLRRLTRAEDGRAPQTSLRAALLDACGAESVDQLVAWVEGAAKSDVAALAPRVVACADAGDAAAAEVVAGAVAELAHLVEAAGSPPATEVVLWGGLVAPGGPLRSTLRGELGRLGLSASDRSVDPPLGAARLARASVSG